MHPDVAFCFILMVSIVVQATLHAKTSTMQARAALKKASADFFKTA